MPVCVVKLCKNNTSRNKKDSGITYHRFPADPVMADRWTAVVRRSRQESWWKPGRCCVICSAHFNKTDFYTTKNGLKKLCKGTLPRNGLFLSSIPPDTENAESKATDAENSIKTIDDFPKCDECKRPVDARELYRCVQCPLVVMCADCGRSNAHAHHCVLRMPSLQIYNKVEYLFELLTDVFHKKLSYEIVDENTNNDDGDDDDDINQELQIEDYQDLDGEKQNQASETVTPEPSKRLKSSASSFLTTWRDEPSIPEPPDEAILSSDVKVEPETDPLSLPHPFNILNTPTDEPHPKKRRKDADMTNTPKKYNATELNINDEIGENKKIEEEHKEVKVKLEPLDSSDAVFVDTEKYTSYGSHRAGKTDL